MHLGLARLCLDCHEVHEFDRCPACTSEVFAFITRWIKLDSPPPRQHPSKAGDAAAAAEKINTYRQILQPTESGSRTAAWLRNGSLLVAAAYVARWTWHFAKNRDHDPIDDKSQSSV